jgi:hypothetical protein
MTIAEIPRVDRGPIWARAEELQRRSPAIGDVTAIAQAMNDYATGQIHLSEPVIVEAARDHPERMFVK